ncbi:signal peptidase I [Oceanibacterium hippocampi]|uniref:Signal peptidase I n=1 Tax=Oceanibacterium hippocampi TaxID=745714 RepID=A0A1Y5U1Y8_9PROT|nr:signal peptidase I [Oceanibacterium hippocampi]SLN77066.1 Signal peptidase I [Oceanibacterium hippocampi]
MRANTTAKGGFGEAVRTIVYAVLIAVGIRTFLFEPFNIPSESMLPNLMVGDYLFVSKFSYGYSRHSLPFSLPLVPGRVFFDQPERGDIAVFKLPADNKTDYIKRIVGLPGDHIQVREGVLYINDMAVEKTKIEDFVYTDPYGNFRRIPQYRETLPNGVSYNVLDMTPRGDLDNTDVYTVPEGHFFAMGDNRDNSQDSRVQRAVGYVPAVNLVGRAEIIFFSHDGSAAFFEFWKWPWAWRWSRFLEWLH